MVSKPEQTRIGSFCCRCSDTKQILERQVRRARFLGSIFAGSQMQESNPGRLGEKCERYLCAMQSPILKSSVKVGLVHMTYKKKKLLFFGVKTLSTIKDWDSEVTWCFQPSLEDNIDEEDKKKSPISQLSGPRQKWLRLWKNKRTFFPSGDQMIMTLAISEIGRGVCTIKSDLGLLTPR